jgi:hypothetical protein
VQGPATRVEPGQPQGAGRVRYSSARFSLTFPRFLILNYRTFKSEHMYCFAIIGERCQTLGGKTQP